MRPKKKKYKNIKQHKRWQRKGILTNRLLENQRVREKQKQGNQKLLPYKMMPENAIRYLKSQVLIKRSSSGIHIHIMKKVVTLQNDRILKSNVGAKNPCFFVRAKIPKTDSFYKVFQNPTGLCLEEAGCNPSPLIRTGIRVGIFAAWCSKVSWFFSAATLGLALKRIQLRAT